MTEALLAGGIFLTAFGILLWVMSGKREAVYDDWRQYLIDRECSCPYLAHEDAIVIDPSCELHGDLLDGEPDIGLGIFTDDK